MLRQTTVVLSCLFALATTTLRGQEPSLEQFRAEFNKGFEYNDAKLMDKALKRSAVHALRYFEELQVAKLRGDPAGDAKIEALRSSWTRCFEQSDTPDKLQRWVELNGSSDYAALEKGRSSLLKLWSVYDQEISKDPNRAEHKNMFDQFCALARNTQSLGHNAEAAEQWLLASVVGSKIPEKDLDDRRAALAALESFIEARKGWNFTADDTFLRNHEFVKVEKLRLEEEAKKDEKRKADGFDPNAKGVESLLVPGKQDTLPLKYEALTAWDTELDYGPKGGPVPAFWWLASTGKDGSNRKLDWFRRTSVYLMRLGAAKFGIALDPNDPKKVVEIDAGNKGKPSTFWLDAEHKQPYSMFFWVGSEKEFVGETEHNMAPSDQVGNVYYRSAASWKTAFGGEPIVLYDDNASGTPCDADPLEPKFRSSSLGEHDGEGTVVPLFDAMRIGKGPRVPYSEFVHFATGWFHMKKGPGDDVVLRPLHADYFKTGKVKLVWAGPKPSMPVQLVLQGSGDYRTACYDVASGKEVEVPAGKYAVIFGRIVIGKGARTQMATLYRGTSPEFDVEPGKVFELKMGAPFSIEFTRRGDQNTSIDALKVLLREASGCVMTEMQGMTLSPEVLAAKAEDGKGAKVVGKFVRFADPELVNKASAKHNNLGLLCACFPMPDGYRDGELVLQVKLPADGMKVGLQMKKHAVFGAIGSKFQ